MSGYFGTDGIRGRVAGELDYRLAYKLGNSLCAVAHADCVVIGGDTRKSTDALKAAAISGVLFGGANVVDLGVAPTPMIAYAAKARGSFGIVVSASHNAAEYNGLKVFNALGEKISDSLKEGIEAFIFSDGERSVSYDKIGSLCQNDFERSEYIDFITSSAKRLNGLKVALDLSNGATYRVAPEVFSSLGADVVSLYCSPDGLNINENCGSTNIKTLQGEVRRSGAQIGFAFDGDGDRVLAVDENGEAVDGDMLIYLLANAYKAEGKLKNNGVVGTKQSNQGLQNALRDRDIAFYRSDVGDSFVVELMEKNGLVLGGEQSGHIILGDRLMTGDGLLAAVTVASLVSKKTPLSRLARFTRYPQVNLNVAVSSKDYVMRSDALTSALSEANAAIGEAGRVVVRASGTENLVRILVEHKERRQAESLAEKIKAAVLLVEKDAPTE